MRPTATTPIHSILKKGFRNPESKVTKKDNKSLVSASQYINIIKNRTSSVNCNTINENNTNESKTQKGSTPSKRSPLDSVDRPPPIANDSKSCVVTTVPPKKYTTVRINPDPSIIHNEEDARGLKKKQKLDARKRRQKKKEA